MGEVLGWLQDGIEWLVQFVPKSVTIRPTHRGLKFVRGANVSVLEPGFHFYWPFWTEIDLCVVARQPHNLASQTLTTLDGYVVEAGAVNVYNLNDVIKAYGGKNYDVDDTINDITAACVAQAVAACNHDDILEALAEGDGSEFLKGLTVKCRKALRPYGVYVQRVGLTDFAATTSFKVHGVSLNVGESD